MNKEFYAGNRKSLYQKLEAGSLVVVSADMHRSRPMMRIIRFLQIVTFCI